MRINTASTFNFGYNKNYHDNFQIRLEKLRKSSPEAGQIRARDILLLSQEDEIIDIEKSGKETTNPIYDNLVQHYITEKIEHAKQINNYFDNDEFSKTLISHYQKEINNSSSFLAKEWRQCLIKRLQTLELSVENLIDEPVDAKKVLELQDADKLKAEQIRAKLHQPIITPQTPVYVDARNATPPTKELGPTTFEIEEAQKHNLTLFKPTKSSPKGLGDVVGMEELKQSFQEDIIDYVKNPTQAKLDEEEYGIRAPRGFLLYGPPGCGKTFITEALASECDFKMYKMNVSQIGAMYVNKSANNLEDAFNFLYKVAKDKDKPILLFMDEVDSLAKDRNKQGTSGAEDMKLLTTLLKHIEQARDNNIIIFAATNKYNLLDDAFISRFDSVKYISLPEIEQIKALLENYLSKRSKGLELSQNKEDLEKLSKEMSGYSNRSIVFILDEACKIAKRDNRSNIRLNHIEEVIKKSNMQKVDEVDYKKDEQENSRKIIKGFC